ncbi:heavy metal translocating P-type ATPase [Planotetraspora phitsanulokensis]|uniref:Metal-transporting ATPase n=1 Tax=Planotetraspora phitsanulokensis TaxID=575192 RepID=A0A8J3U0Y9_9ACTN|nr:metal-transporting ATPase [Planotetraspora phitsanulokensis]
MIASKGADVLERTDTPRDPLSAQPRRTRLLRLAEVRWALAATLLFAGGGIGQLAGAPTWLWWALYLACYAAGGWDPTLSGLRALAERRLDVDLLMVAAAIGAAAIGQITDGALLIVIFATSGALESYATQRTEDSVRGLLDLTPDTATVIRGDGTEQVVPASDLAVGDVILVRPGERVGADGQVLAGASDVDQATITGEPLPAPKQVGDEVFAGTVNGTGALRVRVERPAGDTVLARIVAMVQEASTTKARTQLFIEKVEQRYSVGMVVATLLLFAVPPAFGADFQPTLLRAMTFMIVASPCAVVLATMPPLLSAIANAGRHGVLVKSAVVLEQLGTSTVVAFDKTGTLTEGTPRVTEVRIMPDVVGGESELLALAAAAENPSEHPLARAVVAAAHKAGLPLEHAEEFSALPGRGVRARVAGRVVEAGSPAHLLGTVGQDDVVVTDVATLEMDGQTAVVVRVDGRVAGVVGLADHLRPGAAQAVQQITTLTGTGPIVLTGDNPRAARRIASELGITDVHAGLLPHEKVDAVRALEADGHKVMLVGDGINDAPALAAAHTGLAMGRAGSDLALQTADAVIVRDDLATIPAIIALSRRARRLVTANLIIAAAFITVLVAWDLLGDLPLPLGVAGHEGSTIIVGLNGLRLLRAAAWPTATNGKGA